MPQAQKFTIVMCEGLLVDSRPDLADHFYRKAYCNECDYKTEVRGDYLRIHNNKKYSHKKV